MRTVTKGFDQGQVDLRAQHRTDAPQIRAACKTMHNWAIVGGGAAARRPGSWYRADVEADATRIERISLVSGIDRTLSFSPTQVNIIEESGWTEEDEVTSCPWAAGHIPAMQLSVVEGQRVQVVSTNFWPRRLTDDLAGTWSINSTASSTGFPAFFDEYNNEILAPFRRIAPQGIDLTPGALTGATTMELGPGAQSWFTSDHAPDGLIRHHGRQILVTIFTDGDTVTGGALHAEGLYPTHALTCAGSDTTVGFSVGDPLVGEDTGARATVSSITDATHMDVIYEGYPPSTALSMFDISTPERIVGPTAVTTASASANATPEASTQWDESMISDFAGYPGGCASHKGRNLLFDLARSQDWVAASAVNLPRNFDLGSALASDAIVDGIADSQGARIRYGVSAEQLIFFTTKGPYYVGETPDAPLTPTTWNVNKIGDTPVGDCAPLLTDEGVVFVAPPTTDESGNNIGARVHALVYTGQDRRPYEVADLDTLAGGPDPDDPDADPIIRDPTKLAFTAGLGREKSRYLYARNADSTLAVFRHELGSEIGGWALWHTGSDPDASDIIDVASRGKSLLALMDLGTARRLVEFSFDALLDGQADYSSAVTAYASETGLTLLKNGVAITTGDMDGSGNFVRDDTGATETPASGLYVGWDFTTEMIPVPPTDAESGAAVLEIEGVAPRLVDTQSVTIAGDTITSLKGYASTADPDDVLPRRSWTPDMTPMGDSGEDDAREPAVAFTQATAARCTIASISWRVAYGDD